MAAQLVSRVAPRAPASPRASAGCVGFAVWSAGAPVWVAVGAASSLCGIAGAGRPPRVQLTKNTAATTAHQRRDDNQQGCTARRTRRCIPGPCRELRCDATLHAGSDGPGPRPRRSRRPTRLHGAGRPGADFRWPQAELALCAMLKRNPGTNTSGRSPAWRTAHGTPMILCSCNESRHVGRASTSVTAAATCAAGLASIQGWTK